VIARGPGEPGPLTALSVIAVWRMGAELDAQPR
jgi:hypothetical protein